MRIAIIIGLTILLYYRGTIKNYETDRGSNKTAKILNPIIIFAIYLIYLTSAIDKVRWLFSGTHDPISSIYQRVCFIPPLLNLVVWFLYLFACIWLVILSWTLIQRNENTRKLFLASIPFVWMLECFEMTKFVNEKFGEDPVILASSCILLGMWWLGIYLLYSGGMFRKFFNTEL
jgi:hypothetical protein